MIVFLQRYCYGSRSAIVFSTVYFRSIVYSLQIPRMNCSDVLVKYLVVHKHLHLPSIGKFTVSYQPARLDFTNKLLHPPTEAIMFTHEQVAVDKHFYTFFAEEAAISEVKAIEEFNNQLQQLQQALQLEGAVKLEGIGKLTKEYADTYSFSPSYQVKSYLPVLPAERIARAEKQADDHLEETVETTRSKTEVVEKERDAYWWIYALILFLLGAVALAWYYMQNGSFVV